MDWPGLFLVMGILVLGLIAFLVLAFLDDSL